MNSSDDCRTEQAGIMIRVWSNLFRIVLLLTAIVFSLAVAAEPVSDSLIETGRRIYQDGVLPGGKPLLAIRPEGFVMEGSQAACVSCHRRSGMGSVEGNIDSTVLVPPVAGLVLFVPSRFANSYLSSEHHYVPTDAWGRTLTRPAYDRQSLARSLREGVDPGGRQLLAPMPRYNLDDTAVAALSAYLSQLSSMPAPGVDPDILHIATVVTPDAKPGQAEAVLGVLTAWSESAHGAGKPWKLHVWELSGSAETWLPQLEKRYRQQPVFALLSGVGGSNWAPVHEFCEQQSLACVLPSVEVVPETDDDWYSMYYSPGVGLEARILARYLDDDTAPEREANILQIYSDASGRHAADVFRTGLSGADRSINLRRYRLTSPRASLKGVSAKDVLVLWLRPDEIESLASMLPQGPPAETVFLSALLASPEDVSLPEAWKQRVQFVSLFDDVGLQGEIARLRLDRWLEMEGLVGKGNRRWQADAYVASYLLNEAIGNIRAQEVRRPAVPLTREHVIEMLETLVNKYDDSTGLIDMDNHVAYYGRMSLGPRQRVAVRGGTIMRYASTDSGKLVAASKRIVP
jgi:hypothetical protein